MSSFAHTQVSSGTSSTFDRTTETFVATERLEPSPASPSEKLRLFAKLTLGGALCGAFLGVFVGAFFGILYGLGFGDISNGLDGAFLGSGVLAVLGLFYGAYCGITDVTKTDEG